MIIEECLEFLAPQKWKKALTWPPDAFALCAYLLQKSGSYVNVVSQWPPPGPAKTQSEWVERIRKIGQQWKNSPQEPPIEVKRWWGMLLRNKRADLLKLSDKKRTRQGQLLLWEALTCICAAADECCRGIGLPGGSDPIDVAVRELFMLQMMAVGRISTLCRDVDASKVCILPKLHTPRTGITMRSLSHNLSFLETGEVWPVWSQTALIGMPQLETRLNLLLVPWPSSITPTQFSPVPSDHHQLANMPQEFGFFDYEIRGGGSSWPKTQFERVLRAATAAVDRIDGVVLPELAVRREEADDVFQQSTALLPHAFLIAGVGGAGAAGEFGLNRVLTALPLSQKAKSFALKSYQDKHHRWLLSGQQINQYGLSSRLSPEVNWWENTQLGQRQLQFFSLTPSLTLCSLICEDLARQDPIAHLIRGVGPDLVIALLMDGPQLTNRWPARYATVLADDPGSSVLTLTSLGMARLCRPPGVRESRVIGLWKDAGAGPFEIELPYDAQAVVISIERQDVEEWAADGRSDRKMASRWALKSVFPVRLNDD